MRPGKAVTKRIKFQGRTEASIDGLILDNWYEQRMSTYTYSDLWESAIRGKEWWKWYIVGRELYESR